MANLAASKQVIPAFCKGSTNAPTTSLPIIPGTLIAF
jgi:hypothetical protein